MRDSSPSSSSPPTSVGTNKSTGSSRGLCYLFSSSSSSFLTTTLLAVIIPLVVLSSFLFVADYTKNSPTSSSSWWPSSSFSSSSSWSWRDAEGSGESTTSELHDGHHEVIPYDGEVERENEDEKKQQQEVHGGDHAPYPPAPAPSPQSAPFSFEMISEPKHVISSSRSIKKGDVKLEKLEFALAKARAAIREAIHPINKTLAQEDADYIPQGPVYRNPNAFLRSYQEMERVFKVYVYEEGEPPLFHDGPCKSIYSMEGRFIHNMDMESKLRTRDPDKAHVHFLPFSVTKMVHFIYEPDSFDINPIRRTIVDYVNVIAKKYPYWNRSLGADHFMLSCHDWGPKASTSISHLYSNSIRVLCNANTSEGFNPSKDVSLPEINLKTGLITGIIGGPSASHRPILAFFAGGLHGPIRPVLLEHWKGKDEDVQVYEYLPKGILYYDMMKKSKFCICPSGYEVASPRIVEAIYLECVPVIISSHYVPPFSDILNWNSFSVQVPMEEIPNLKNILASISPRQYIRMQRRVKLVQRHFVINSTPKRFDVFHMILHSIWLRRLNIHIHPQD